MPAKGYRATHCKRGHAFTDDNTLWSKGRNGEPKRACRQCLVDGVRKKRGSTRTGPPQAVAMEQERRLQAETGTKRCTRCGERKPLDDFKRHNKTHDGRYPACKACCAKRYQERSTPETRARMTRRIRDANWGLVPGQYDAMLDAQGGVCAICEERCKSGKSLAVDHDHTTGAIRGLLCANCNRAVGMMADSPLRLRRAAHYLETHADQALSTAGVR